MLNPLDTRIVFFGGGARIASLEALARLAQAGYQIVAGEHDPREGVVLHEIGALDVPNRSEAVIGAQVVITSFNNAKEVEDFYFGESGLIELVEPGTYIIDLTNSTPQLAREIQAMGAINDVNTIDCPLVNFGEKEEAIAFVGGEPDVLEDISGLLPYLAATIYKQKEPGEGQLAALLALVGLAGSLMGAIEAMAIAHIAGYDNQSAVNALASTSAGSRALVDYIPQVLGHDYTGRIRVREFLDALEGALEVSEAMGVTLPMTETAYQLCDLLSVVGGEELNIQALALLYEDEQTCADFGLDWALAEQMSQDGRLGYGGMESGMYGQYLEYGPNDYDDFGDDGMDEAGCGHHHEPPRGPQGGTPSGGFPSISSFFSPN